MRLTINTNLYPKEGYRFKDKDGVLHASTAGWVDLMRKVQAYRKRKGQPVGDVEVEVLTQACNRNPGFCSELSPQVVRQRLVVSLKGRVLSWLNMFRRMAEQKRVEYVQPGEASRRAEICAKCPNNTPLPEGCASCRAAVTASRKAIIGGRTIDGRLNGCCVTGEDIPSSIWIEQQTVENGALPGECWRKRTL